jgi:hypothetical protein
LANTKGARLRPTPADLPGPPRAARPAPRGPAGTPAPVPLPDARPVPPEFSPRRTRALMYNEGATWAWHWGVINNILLFSMCAKGSGGQQSFLVPEGWEPVGPGTGQLPGIYDLVQTDGSPPMPFMALLKTTNSSDGQLSIVFRGTNSGPEWMLGGPPATAGPGNGGCGRWQTAAGPRPQLRRPWEGIAVTPPSA